MSSDIEQRFAFPWYREGLRFRCTQCGQCCTGSPGFVWITAEEIEEMAQFLALSPSTFKRLYVKRVDQRYTLVEKKSQNHSCIFYQNQRCQVYAARPLQCRAYPFWQENIHSQQSWDETAKSCEGIQPDSPLVPYETIERLLEAQREQSPRDHYVPKLCIEPL